MVGKNELISPTKSERVDGFTAKQLSSETTKKLFWLFSATENRATVKRLIFIYN